MGLPTIQIDREELERYISPAFAIQEGSFLLFALLNPWLYSYQLKNITPYPIIFTLMQVGMGLLFMNTWSAASVHWPNAHFPPALDLTWRKILRELLFPGIAYTMQLLSYNLFMNRIESVSLIPVALALSIVLHHSTRLLGCGQTYSNYRWSGVWLMMLGFMAAATMDKFFRPVVLPAVMYAVAAAIYRAAAMERAIHVTEGANTTLQVGVHWVGILVLPVLILLFGNGEIHTLVENMPWRFSEAFTWLHWGTVITLTCVPLFKNVVSNMLISHTGQIPWRVLELFAMLTMFTVGLLSKGSKMTSWSYLSFFLVFFGRCINSFDAVSDGQMKESELPFRKRETEKKEKAMKGLDEPLMVKKQSSIVPLVPSGSGAGVEMVASDGADAMDEVSNPVQQPSTADPSSPAGQTTSAEASDLKEQKSGKETIL